MKSKQWNILLAILLCILLVDFINSKKLLLKTEQITETDKSEKPKILPQSVPRIPRRLDTNPTPKPTPKKKSAPKKYYWSTEYTCEYTLPKFMKNLSGEKLKKAMKNLYWIKPKKGEKCKKKAPIHYSYK